MLFYHSAKFDCCWLHKRPSMVTSLLPARRGQTILVYHLAKYVGSNPFRIKDINTALLSAYYGKYEPQLPLLRQKIFSAKDLIEQWVF